MFYEMDGYIYLTGFEMVTDSNATQILDVAAHLSTDKVSWATFGNTTDFSHIDTLVRNLIIALVVFILCTDFYSIMYLIYRPNGIV